MNYSDDLIVGEVPKVVRDRVRENMNCFCMGLYDAFDDAVRECIHTPCELFFAWYVSDYRKFIPEAYLPKYLNFELFPLRYS